MTDKIKEWLPVLLVAGVCAACVVACSGNKEMGDLNPAITSAFKLATDPNTGIVYIENYNRVYTPYYSKNGKLCKYEDGVLVEIEEDEDD